MPELARKVSEIPLSQTDRLNTVRESMLRNVRKSLNAYSGPLREDADKLMADILAASDLPTAQRTRVVRRLIEAFYQRNAGTLATSVGQLVEDTSAYVQRYERTLAAYHVQKRFKLKDLPGPGDVEKISAYETAYYQQYGQAGVQASTAYQLRGARQELAEREVAAARRAAQAQGRALSAAREEAIRARLGQAKPVTTGDKLAVKNLYRYTGDLSLSTRMHGPVAEQSREATRVILRQIRESESLGSASREIHRLLKDKVGAPPGGGEKLPKLMQQLSDAGKALAKGDPRARDQINATLKRINKYQRQLRSGRTVQNGYVELLERLKSPKVRAETIANAVDSWSYWKQRYHAEKWMRTESAAAYRTSQIEGDLDKPWVVGYKWLLFAAGHAKWVKTKPGNLTAYGGKHCICEQMHGQILSKEVALQYPRGGHPHCMCSLRPVFDLDKMVETPITPSEKEWLAQPDDPLPA
jgi:hypothetical protein